MSETPGFDLTTDLSLPEFKEPKPHKVLSPEEMGIDPAYVLEDWSAPPPYDTPKGLIVFRGVMAPQENFKNSNWSEIFHFSYEAWAGRGRGVMYVARLTIKELVELNFVGEQMTLAQLNNRVRGFNFSAAPDNMRQMQYEEIADILARVPLGVHSVEGHYDRIDWRKLNQDVFSGIL